MCASSFLAGLLFGPRLYRALLITTHFVKRTEEMRVTDPTGHFDAVIVTEAAGDIDWYIYIALKGKSVPGYGLRPIFEASELDGAQLVWRGPHVLEIHYDFAYIQGFRNQWESDEVEDVGPNGERELDIRIRLPSDGNRLGQ